MKTKANTLGLVTAVGVLATLGAATATLKGRDVWTTTLSVNGQREATPCQLTNVGDWKFDQEGRAWRAVQVVFAGFDAGNVQVVSHTRLFTDAACTQALEVGPAPAPRESAAPSQSAAPRNPFNPGILRSASWVIRDIATQHAVLETWDPRKVIALNTAKYEAWPIGAHLASFSRNA
ncbi:hypothetical protein [Paraburkholderia youngii]|uniref:hypothetical protein n=1 Tax=Paraburkholderia youngii TaxID=2782701 RepID=UPI003D25EE95